MKESLAHSTLLDSLINKIGAFKLACGMVFISLSSWVIAFIYPNEHNFSPF